MGKDRLDPMLVKFICHSKEITIKSIYGKSLSVMLVLKSAEGAV